MFIIQEDFIINIENVLILRIAYFISLNVASEKTSAKKASMIDMIANGETLVAIVTMDAEGTRCGALNTVETR